MMNTQQYATHINPKHGGKKRIFVMFILLDPMTSLNMPKVQSPSELCVDTPYLQMRGRMYSELGLKAVRLK